MVVTNKGISGLALQLTPSGTYPRYLSIGIGSKNENANVTTMGSESMRQVFTTTNMSTQKKVLWTTDFSSVQMSGLNFREFALQTGSPATEIWHYTNLGDSLNFDGSNELRIELTWTLF